MYNCADQKKKLTCISVDLKLKVQVHSSLDKQTWKHEVVNHKTKIGRKESL